MKYVVLYELAEEGLPTAIENFPAHRELNVEFKARGTLLMTGPFADPTEGAMAIFTTREAAEEFVSRDPFVLKNAVRRWHVREWNEGFGL